ncbi:putative sporulation protein YtxC [Bacillus horti]|uniref:Sporulation protein YtxC n=1 Tax=Caldalkalibacillus horti TaxID=77523 RepID=A0ABT9VWL7_9BACI|nr:putative sporulation protein YtxC [Bacillus horti]MDQ0165372.1 putative sporulation protein YtxC [Bacillus horti]
MIKMVPLTTIKWEHFTPYLLLQLTGLEDRYIGFEVKDNYKCIHIQGYSLDQKLDPPLSHTQVDEQIKNAFCQAISEFYVEELEEEYIKMMIKKVFGFVQPEQIERIYHFCFDMLFLHEDSVFRDEAKISERKRQIFDCAYDYIQEEKEFHLDGFIRFRLSEYRYELEELIEFAVDEYIVDQEYQRFIQLLQQYVAQQIPQIPILHVHHRQGRRFVLFNQDGEQLTEQQIEQYLNKFAIESVTHEDIIVSTLIAMAPKIIILHTTDPNVTIIRTLQTIFQTRLELCLNCQKCKQWQERKLVQQ